MQVMTGKSSRRDPPFQKELFTAFVFTDPAGGFSTEMIDTAVAYPFEEANTGFPEFTREIGVGIHAGGELHAIAADEVPPLAVDDIGRPGSPAPVWKREPGESSQEGCFVKSLR